MSRRDYEIAFVGLKPGVHEFFYEITQKFFEEHGAQEFWDCHATVKLLLEKSPNFMLLRFQVGGSLKVICDRCSSNLPMPLFEDFTVTIKAVENPEEMNDTEEDPDVFYISRGESHLDVAPMIYEFINLSIPMQKECGFENMDSPYCDADARQALLKMRDEAGAKPNTVWQGLEKFKDLEG